MPAKAKSKAQYKFMQMIAHGKGKGEGMSKDQAAEFVEGQSPKGLPERVAKKGKKKLHSAFKGIKPDKK